MRFAWVVFLAAATASARPYAPKADFCVPERALPEVHIVAGKTVVCFAPSGDCLQLGEEVSDRKVVRHPTATPIEAAHVRDLAGQLAVCTESCEVLGTKLALRVAPTIQQTALGAEDLDRKDRIDVGVTLDMKTVVVREGDQLEVWNTKKDRATKVKPPRKQTLVGFDVIGSTVIASWSNHTSSIVDAGSLKGSFASGHVVGLDADRFAVVPEGADGKLAIIDAKKGKSLATIELVAGTIAKSTAVRVSDSELALLWSVDGKSYETARVAVPKSKTATRGSVQQITACN